MPLGSGQEVGRSCHFMQFKGKKIMFDCGIHPGMQGVDALPFVDFIDVEELDLLLITHFHLDHCGALPWLLEKTAFRGRCFMTHATKAIYRTLIGDCIKIAKYGGGSGGGHESRMLYTEEDLERSMDKIEVLDFHEQKEVNGIKFWCYVAGHVLGACMFMVEIAGVRTLYTGDFSRLEDRHLCAAELPNVSPDVMICESTYGTQIHESREERERRFTSTVHEIVGRGGRCLIPAFALGRAQELLLILDEYWEQHPELHDIPVYYASSLAKKCMAVYQTFVSGMNQSIKRQISINNPFVFKHVSNLKSIDHFDDVGPCVVLASPGMLQNGLSRELFETWCTDSKNGCLVAGYCVEGTLAKHILSEPEEIVALNGQRLPMRLQVAYISFSAHTDYIQTSEFIRALRPPNLILVHGEMNEMNRLKAAVLRQYEDDTDFQIEVYNPRNTESVQLYFRGQKTAKVVGQLAMDVPEDGSIVSGILVRRNFNYHLLHPNELSAYTDLANSRLSQRESVSYEGSFSLLLHNLRLLSTDAAVVTSTGEEDEKPSQQQQLKTSGSKGGGASTATMTPSTASTPIPTHVVKMFRNEITIAVYAAQHIVIIEWMSNPVNDLFADAALSAILHAQTNPLLEKNVPKEFELKTAPIDDGLEAALVGTLRELCGEKSRVEVKEEENQDDDDSMRQRSDRREGKRRRMIELELDGKRACICPSSLQITDCEDQLLHHLLASVTQKIAHGILPI
uniref:Cleavage and polyadenylation specificity factor n=1 Tax=Globodera rostochiensis TaxID=31243 RepID=A0A914HRZ5_GLORO